MEDTGDGKVQIVWRHPNKAVYKKGPIILDYKDHSGKKFFFRPNKKNISDGVKAWVYTVELFYAQKLLSAQPDRYFLLDPDELIVPVVRGMSSENKVFKSILITDKDKLEDFYKPKIQVLIESEPAPDTDTGPVTVHARPGVESAGLVKQAKQDSAHDEGKSKMRASGDINSFLKPLPRRKVDE